MREQILSVLLFLVPSITNSLVWAQGDPANSQPSPPSASAPPVAELQPGTTVPRLVRFSGVVTNPSGKPGAGTVTATFSLYELQEGGSPLWAETQNIQMDDQGRYTVLLGATLPEGLPLDLFTTGKARWLGVQPQLPGAGEQPRVLLVGMPYALKASDADTLGGKPASSYVLSQDQAGSAGGGKTAAMGSASGHLGQAQKAGAENAQENNGSWGAAGGSGTPHFIPIWTSSTTLGNSILYQTLGEVGLGTKTPGARLDSVSKGIGVRGTSSSATGSGVVGLATSTSTSTYQNGVYGQNAGAGAGVAGIATNPSTGVGVYGQSANFAGVFGNALAPSGYSNGVYGQTASTVGGSGVVGISTATSGFSNGVFGQTVNWVGVGGQATATSGVPAYGVWGDSASTGGVGVAGFADATSGYTNGVYGNTASHNGNGVSGNATAPSGYTSGVSGSVVSPNGSGVLGLNFASLGPSATGVSGLSFATSGFGQGVYGQAASSTGAGVFGQILDTASYAAGVLGQVLSPNGVAGQFSAHSGQGLILQGLSGSNYTQVFTVDASGNLDISGNLTVAGSKSARVKLQDGREVALYAVESPENWFEDFGTAQLQGGAAEVALEPGFLQTVDTAADYHVFLTPNGDCHGLYVARKTSAGFEVRELGGGSATIAFDYRIVARRRGFETVRLQEVHIPQGPKSMPARLASMRPPEHVAPPAPPLVVPPQPPKITIPPIPHPVEPPH